MNPRLRDLFGHQQWGDAEHWRALEAHPAAAADAAIRNRLHHIHLVQRAFRWMVSDRQTPLPLTTPDDFPTLRELKEYARGYHEEIAPFLNGLPAARFEQTID